MVADGYPPTMARNRCLARASIRTGFGETASDHQTGCKAGKWNAGPANVCTLCVWPGPMASAHIAKAIAATINAKPIEAADFGGLPRWRSNLSKPPTMGDMLVLAICTRFVATVANVLVYAARIMLG